MRIERAPSVTEVRVQSGRTGGGWEVQIDKAVGGGSIDQFMRARGLYKGSQRQTAILKQILI